MYFNYENNDSRTIKRVIGDNAEEAVINIMQQQGYRLIARNFSIHNVGELDSVYIKDDDLYVVEVKSRKNNNGYAAPEECIPPSKVKKIIKTTKIFILRNKLFDYNVNFLIGSVTHNREGLIQNVEIIPF